MLTRGHLCASCGGAIDRQGRALTVLTRVSSSGGPVPTSAARPQPLEDDPLPDLSPVERFNQAIDRRDRLVRDRRTAAANGRRATDRVPLDAGR